MPGQPKYHGLNSPRLKNLDPQPPLVNSEAVFLSIFKLVLEKLTELLTILNQCCNIEINSNEYIN